MTCYLRLHEVAVAVHPAPGEVTDWDEVGRRWRLAHGVDGRDGALDAMPVPHYLDLYVDHCAHA